eukprot:5026787-Prymnesium_polylepis.1
MRVASSIAHQKREVKGRANCSPSVNARQARRRQSDAAADSSRGVVERPRRGLRDHARKPICRHALHAAGSASARVHGGRTQRRRRAMTRVGHCGFILNRRQIDLLEAETSESRAHPFNVVSASPPPICSHI